MAVRVAATSDGKEGGVRDSFSNMFRVSKSCVKAWSRGKYHGVQG
jgi:hypothetical protein